MVAYEQQIEIGAGRSPDSAKSTQRHSARSTESFGGNRGSRNQAASLIDEYKFEQAFDTYDEMLEDGELDAVIICLPTALHERSVSAAFDAGLHVLCESAPAVSESEMSKIVSNAAGFAAKPTCGLGNNAFHPQSPRLERSSNAGGLAKPIAGVILAMGLVAFRRRQLARQSRKRRRGLAGHRYPHDRFDLVSHGLS